MSSAAAAKPILYSYFRSSCSWRVRIALALKGIAYEYRAISLIKDGGEQFKDEFRSVNPQREVPVLEIDGHQLAQSLAIIEYLEETRPDGASLLPKDAHQRALVRQVSDAIAQGIQPIQNLRVLNHVGDEKKVEWARHWINHGLAGLEALLAKTHGKYSVGDTVTMADCTLVPQLYNARRFKVDLSQFPIALAIENELIKLDAFKAAHPSAQPDCPESERGTQ
ncbi:maleylacetoacetate isomerase [Capsaspora owczarzaki ATCC 30864]|uniref:Maleylacetoacetate isomerase n=1 Tax=Capsaspora owczarzaki (strain ATCC 30864) TaxID=595528 RepID=A0A0D2X059_CAPO3|nr:maleylacetoacetate isomerase [Capsaspora owczarzaki ATCC 30864]KJE88489.1 maleylacetoacetate isomerase [Capsaspora owczarzaki ATCC 30864]|eukprot:XP_004365010.1 maleylacetoacetate isomerase [Capsaspora owczarzaki ATCC 30864]